MDLSTMLQQLKQEHKTISRLIETIEGAAPVDRRRRGYRGIATESTTTKRHTMSPEGRARIAAAQKARWAAVKAEVPAEATAPVAEIPPVRGRSRRRRGTKSATETVVS